MTQSQPDLLLARCLYIYPVISGKIGLETPSNTQTDLQLKPVSAKCKDQ